MVTSRTAKSVRNIKFAIIGQAAGILISFVSRRAFVVFLGKEYLGIDGLFTNILSLLSLAELGVGTAIIFCLYKPLAEKDTERVKSLMSLFKKAYTAIGCVIAVVGVALSPFLSVFVAEMPDMPYIRLYYVMFVVNSAISYFFTYKRSLIVADQNRYIATWYRYIMYFGLNVAQIIILVLTHNYILFLSALILNTMLENILVSRKANKMYPFLLEKNIAPLSKEDRHTITKNVGAMMAHKIGGVVVNGTDNLLLSRLVGIVATGLYSNYFLVTNALNAVYNLIVQSITASLGNLGATADEEKNYFVFNVLNFVMYWIYAFSAICLLILFNPFIEMWLGGEFLFDFPLVAVIVFNFYLTGMRKGVLAYRDALGLFWYDRYKPIVESIINIVASILLGIQLGTIGIFLGTAISTLTTCFWIEPYVLYRYGFFKNVLPYFKRYGIYTLAAAVAGAVCFLIVHFITLSGLPGFAVTALVCLIVPNALLAVFFHKTKEFGYMWDVLTGMIRSRFDAGKKED